MNTYLEKRKRPYHGVILAIKIMLSCFESTPVYTWLYHVFPSHDVHKQEYQQSFAKMRTFNIRGKLAEEGVRHHYYDWR